MLESVSEAIQYGHHLEDGIEIFWLFPVDDERAVHVSLIWYLETAILGLLSRQMLNIKLGSCMARFPFTSLNST